METRYFFNLRRDRTNFNGTWRANCAITGPCNGTEGAWRIFTNRTEVENAFYMAKIEEHRFKECVSTVQSGFASFFEISLAEAESLLMIKTES